MSKGIIGETLRTAYPISVLLAGIFAVGINMDLTGVKNMHPLQIPTKNSQTSLMSLIPIALPECSDVENKYSTISFFCTKKENLLP